MSAEKPRKSGDLKVIQAQAVGMDDASSQALSEALGSSFLLVRILVFVLIAAFVISCVFTVNPNEVAVVLRFGKPVGVGREMIKSQGLHFAFPYPIDEIVRIRNGEALTAMSRTSWYQVDPGEEIANKEPEPKERLNPAADGHLLMGDGNILHARAVLKYRIADPVAYTFQFLEASNLVTCALDNAIYRTAAAYRADEALYKDKAGFRSAVQDRLQEWISKSGLGISIDVLDVPVAAPGFVKQAFDFVIQSEQQQGSKVSQARGDFDRIVREAGGEAQEILGRSQVLSNSLVQSVIADADTFEKQRSYYARNPSLFKARLLNQVLERVYTNATDKFVAESKELRILMNRPPVTPAKQAPGPAQ